MRQATTSKELHSHLKKVISDTLSIEDALKDVRNQDITWWDDNSEVGVYCKSLDYHRKKRRRKNGENDEHY